MTLPTREALGAMVEHRWPLATLLTMPLGEWREWWSVFEARRQDEQDAARRASRK